MDLSSIFDLSSVFIANGTGFFILLMLWHVSRTKILRRRTEDRVYSFMVLGVMLGCAMETFSYILDGRVFPGARLLNYAANTYLYSMNLLLPLCVLFYTDLGIYGDVSRIWKHYKPQIILCILMFGVNMVNFFIPISYYITEQNVYERRPASYLFYLVIMYYCLTSLYLEKRYEKENGARSFFNILFFLVPILLGASLQFMFYGLSLAWLSSALGLMGLFMMQQNENAYIDSLADTYNRQYMNVILSAWISRGKRFAGVMLDIDHFKRINDQYGHSEGDNALKTVTDILKGAKRDHEWVFRYAGDEFVVLKMTDDPNGLSAYMNEVNKRLDDYNRAARPYPIALSYGMGCFESGNIDTFIKELDTQMYEMKAKHHEKG